MPFGVSGNMGGNDELNLEELRMQLEETKRQLEQERQRNRDSEPSVAPTQPDGEARSGSRPAMESSMEVAPINEADVTLRRLVQRIAMILQAEKIAIMFYDRELGGVAGGGQGIRRCIRGDHGDRSWRGDCR